MDYDLLFEKLTPLFQEKKWELFKKVIAQRTRYITVVLEDLYKRQNASAVLRTSECYGVQHVYVIENENQFEVSPKVDLGASKWMDITYFNQEKENTLAAINHLKSEGYRIVATSPAENSKSIIDLDVTAGKIALVFGTEVEGISDVVRENADEFVHIPMSGFTESFNISVSAAICLHEVFGNLKKQEVNYQLSKEEQNKILLEWMTKTIAKGDKVVPLIMKQLDIT